ncbi:Dynein heavy chain 6, axonemal, partial [Rhizoclosmatium hyalinum]
MDLSSVAHIIRSKRRAESSTVEGADDLDKLGLGHVRTGFSGVPVIPPIAPSEKDGMRLSLVTPAPIKSADSKRVRLMLPDDHQDVIDERSPSTKLSQAETDFMIVDGTDLASLTPSSAKPLLVTQQHQQQPAPPPSPNPSTKSHRSQSHEKKQKVYTFQLGSEEVAPTGLAQCKTPFDFIKYIETRPSNTKEFAYLVALKPSLQKGSFTFNPYNLEIVPYDDIAKSDGYYTISNKGITCFNHLGHGEFTPLHQWLREHKLFHKLLQIPFFARYRIWKCFTVWHRTVLHTKITLAKQSLQKTLFFAHPILCPTLFEVRALCAQAAQRTFVNVEEGRGYELQEFLKEQVEWVTGESATGLREWERRVRELVEGASTRCLKEKGFDITLKEVDENEQENALKGIFKGPRLTYTEQSARKSECLRLQRFVKVVDYMVVNTLHMLVVDSVMELLGNVFWGCHDSDVVVDGYEGADALRDEQISLLMTLERPGGANEAVEVVLEQTRKASSGSLGSLDAIGASVITSGTVQVGGVIVGPEVRTSELMMCGFDGFASILRSVFCICFIHILTFISSRILRSAMIQVEIREVYDEDKTRGHGVKMMEVDEPSLESSRVTTVSKSVADARKSTVKALLPTKQCPLFKLELLLHYKSPTKHLYFEPSLPDFLNAIDELLKSYVLAVEEFHLLTNTIPFLDPSNLAGGAYSSNRGLEESEFGEGPQVTAIITEGGYFREVCGRIRGVVVGNFLNAAEWMLGFNEVR